MKIVVEIEFDSWDEAMDIRTQLIDTCCTKGYVTCKDVYSIRGWNINDIYEKRGWGNLMESKIEEIR